MERKFKMLELLNTTLMGLAVLFVLSALAHAAPAVKECGYKSTTEESIKDCFQKLGAEKTIECFTMDENSANTYFPCDQWEEKKKLKVNLYLHKLENYKEKVEQIWNIVTVYVPRGPSNPDAPRPIEERSCGMINGSEEERIDNCRIKFGEIKTQQCFVEPFSFSRMMVNCAHWNNFVAENIAITKQVLVTLLDYGPKIIPAKMWKTVNAFVPVSIDEVSIDNFNRPKFPTLTCGTHGTITERMADCQQMLAQAGTNYASQICYLSRSTSVENLRKVPCIAEQELKGQSAHFQSWRLISMDSGENKVWFDDHNKRIWSSLLPKTRSVFSGIKACRSGKTAITSAINSEAIFYVPTCSALASSMHQGLKKLVTLEKSVSNDVWCSVDQEVLLKWNVKSGTVYQSQNPFENNSLICAGHEVN